MRTPIERLARAALTAPALYQCAAVKPRTLHATPAASTAATLDGGLRGRLEVLGGFSEVEDVRSFTVLLIVLGIGMFLYFAST